MNEDIEIRIIEDRAQEYLNPDEGHVLGGTVRRLKLPFSSDRVQYIGKINKELRRNRILFVTWCNISRRYTQNELSETELFNMIIRKTFEPSGEECGTQHDETIACPRCGLGRIQTTNLILDLRKLTKRIDTARTIAGEIIVSSRFVESWRKHELKGATFMPVLQKGRLRIVSKEWYQIIPVSEPVMVVSPTHAANSPFDDDCEDRYRCPGHVLGLNLISELTVSRAGYDGSDLVTTDLAFGWKQGVLMPERPLIISQKARTFLAEDEIKGFHVERVYIRDK